MDEHAKRKLLPYFVGPFRVLEVLGKGNLNRRLALSENLKERLQSDVFHIEKLKPAGEQDDPFYITANIPPPEEMDEDKEFYVEKILAYEQYSKGKQYLVKWEGYPDSENRWIWEWNLENAQDRIRDFWKTDPVQKNPTRRSRRAKRVRLVKAS